MAKPVNVRQIAEALDLDYALLSHTINKLLKHKEIGCIELDRIKAADFLGTNKITLRMRFYLDIDLVGQFQFLL